MKSHKDGYVRDPVRHHRVVDRPTETGEDFVNKIGEILNGRLIAILVRQRLHQNEPVTESLRRQIRQHAGKVVLQAPVS